VSERRKRGGKTEKERARKRTLFLLVERLDHLDREVDLDRLIRLDAFRLATAERGEG
jgi:hypothetical protein